MENISSKREQMASLLDLLNKTRFEIFTYLNMYGKLSLTEIAEKLNKSKSTIYEHIKKLKKVNGIVEEKRAIYSDPNSDKPKVFENVYSLNPKFSTEIDAFIPGLNPGDPTINQAKAVIDVLLFAIKIRKSNLNISQRFLEKLGEDFDKEPEKIMSIVKKLISGLYNPKYEIEYDEAYESSKEDLESMEFPSFSTYVHLSTRQFNIVSEKFAQFCQLFYSKEFNKAEDKEKPFIFMITGIPMKSFLEFLK